MIAESVERGLLLWFGAIIGALDLFVLLTIVIGKAVRDLNERRYAAARRRVTEALLPFLESDEPFHVHGRVAVIGDERYELPRPRGLVGRAARETIVSFLAALRGEARERLVTILHEGGYVEPVARALRSRSAIARARAAMLLGGMRATGAGGALVDRVLHDRSPEVRAVAAEALGALHNVASVPILIAALRDPARHSELRISAVLVRLGAAAVPAVETVLHDADERVVRLALDVLLDIGASVGASALAVSTGHASPEVRARAAELLGASGDPAAGAAALELTHDEIWFVRVRAAKALDRLGVPEEPHEREAYYGRLERMLDDPVWHVRRNAAATLADAGRRGERILRAHGGVGTIALQLRDLRGGAAPT